MTTDPRLSGPTPSAEKRIFAARDGVRRKETDFRGPAGNRQPEITAAVLDDTRWRSDPRLSGLEPAITNNIRAC
jgi:hypothetical protein